MTNEAVKQSSGALYAIMPSMAAPMGQTELAKAKQKRPNSVIRA